MEPYRDDDLAAALSAVRPTPRPAFAAELDARVAAGFPRESRLGTSPLSGALDRLRALKPRQVLLPAGATALTAIVIATAVVAGGRSGSESDSGSGVLSYTDSDAPQVTEEAAPAEAGGGFLAPGATVDRGGGFLAPGATVDRSAAAGQQNRAVERSAEITLGTDPAEVGDAAAKVFDVVHANRGIVLRSSTSDGAASEASAEFELLIPSGKLGDALAAISGIAEVRSRHEASADITAPTVGVAEHLEDSQARIDGLLAQLAEAGTDSERETVEAELRTERRRAAGLRVSLQSLERRANLSRVAVRIESGESAAPDAGGAWGIGDALDDAGRILAVGAAIALVSLAIVGPIALIALLAWLAHRAWLRRARRLALS